MWPLFNCECFFLLLVSFCGSETPLSVAVQSALPMEAIRVLVQGGAHLDFRNRDGFTALHKAVWAQNHAGLLVRTAEQRCIRADHKQNKSTQWELNTRSFCLKKPRNCAFLLFPQVLLTLGASPNYKDRCGLTPLYHTVLAGGDTSCCETLLYYRATLGTRDENGWDESHQVPRTV